MAVIVVAGVVAVTSGALSGHGTDAAGRHVSTDKRPTHHPRPLHLVYSPPRSHGATSSSEEQADNAKIAQAAAGDSTAWAAIEAMALPSPSPSAQFPSIPHGARQDPGSYATAFVSELLSIDFAKQDRPSLLSWAVSETSPETMPGTPASAAAKFLYANLTSSNSPVPSARAWTANAASGVTWSASGLSMTTCPIWVQVLATGWQPPDLRMDCLDVTGNLTITQPGQPPALRPFSLQLGLGSAEYHHGYGAMSLNNWTVG